MAVPAATLCRRRSAELQRLRTLEFPQPEIGLVISNSYLWSDEAEAGHVERRKNRPCAIVGRSTGKAPVVTVVPITHSPHRIPGRSHRDFRRPSSVI
jgi:hypothetical protein